jgi:hypothetical protein
MSRDNPASGAAVPSLDFQLAVLHAAARRMDPEERAALLAKLKAFEAMLKGVAQFCAMLELVAENPPKH